MKLDKRVIKVAVLPIKVESICVNCIYRNTVACCETINDIDRPISSDSPVIECYETPIKRIVTKCAEHRRKPLERVQNKGTSFDYKLVNGERILVKKNPKKIK